MNQVLPTEILYIIGTYNPNIALVNKDLFDELEYEFEEYSEQMFECMQEKEMKEDVFDSFIKCIINEHNLPEESMYYKSMFGDKFDVIFDECLENMEKYENIYYSILQKRYLDIGIKVINGFKHL